MLMEKSYCECAIALGSNMGDSLGILTAAIDRLNAQEGIIVKKVSQWYKTRPVGPPQPDYLNGCAILTVNLPPLSLLDQLLEVEEEFGRERSVKWGPRTLDLDLLLYDSLIIDLPKLQVPHPLMIDRSFVLVPLAEIAPDWIHPTAKTSIANLLERLDL